MFSFLAEINLTLDQQVVSGIAIALITGIVSIVTYKKNVKTEEVAVVPTAVSDLRSVIEVLQTELKQNVKRHEEENARYRVEVAQLQSRLDEAEASIEVMAKENKTLRSRLKKYELKFGKGVVE